MNSRNISVNCPHSSDFGVHAVSIGFTLGDGPDVEELHPAGLDKLNVELPAALCDPRAYAGVDESA